MNYKVATLPQFDKDLKHLAKKYRSIKADLAALELELIANPKTGDEVIKDCYKVRMSITSKGKGKSGGARVITYVWVHESTVLLLTIYDKSEKGNVPVSKIKELLKSIGINS